MLSFARVLHEVKCPVPWILAVAHSAGRIQKHFMYRHFISKVAMVQEGKDPPPRCDLCRMYMPEGRLASHKKTAH